MTTRVEYRPQTAAETLRLVVDGVDSWLAVGQFLDDWRRTAPADRASLCCEPPPDVPVQHQRWAALLAAAAHAVSVATARSTYAAPTLG